MCKCKNKSGDKFLVISESGHSFKKGELVTLIGCGSGNILSFVNDSKKTQLLELKEVKKVNKDYVVSNRYKLHQEIRATGFHAEKLSLASGFKKGYFSDYTSESRFNSRGDITEDRLNSLLTTLAFAERELLGVGAKTVDDNPIIDKTIQSESSDEIDLDLKEAIKESEINDQNKLYAEYFYSANKRIQKKKDAKVKNFMIVFLVFVVILSVYFLTR